MVKRLRREAASAVAGIALAAGLGGCAIQATGVVAPLADGSGTGFLTSEGERLRLRLGPDAAPLAYLDGHEVALEGSRIGTGVRVSDWKVVGGLHGLQVWVGPLDVVGLQIGIADRNTGSYFYLDEASWDVLSPFDGATLLVEGWVEGAHRLRVVYYRVLAPEDPSPGDGP
jgi:hypothetical protein